MDSNDDTCWDFLDYNFIDENHCTNFLWPDNQSCSVDIDFSSSGGVSQDKECSRKRGRDEACSKAGSKACRERLRREKLNDRFVDLSAALEPSRPAKTDKSALLDDAIRVLNQLRTEARELRDANEKLREEIKTLKAEKNELREEKMTLKADKESMEQQLKLISVPQPSLIAAHPSAYHAGASKISMFPGYGLIPLWHYLTPTTCDTSRDHELRPPAA